MKRLHDIYEFKNGISKEKSSFGQGTPILNYKDVYLSEKIDGRKLKGLVNANESELQRFSVLDNDLFFTRTSETSDEIGLSSTIINSPSNTVFSGFILRARPISQQNSNYYAYLFRASKYRKEIIKHSSITTRALTSGKLLGEIEILNTDIKYQNKVATLLSSIDHLIITNCTNLESLKNGKKSGLDSLMGNYAESKKIKFSKFLSKQNKTFYIEDTIKYKQITISNDGQIKMRGEKLGSEIGRKRQYKLEFEPHDKILIFIRQGIFNGGIGFVENLDLNGAIVTENMPMFVLDTRYICKEFFKQYLKSSYYDKNILFPLKPIGSAQSAIHEKDWLESIGEFPSLETQSKIANLLSSMDKLIEIEEKKLEKLTEMKKYYLQQFFN